MAKHYNMTVTPWAPLAGGALTGKYLRGDIGRLKEGSNRLNERSVAITKEVIAIADELGVQPSHVALKWTMQRGFSCIPIVGATKLTQLEENLKTTEVNLTYEQIKRLDDASAIVMGFPNDFLNEDGVKQNNFGGFYDKIEKRS
jgi:aryl-alcohol dehydrogenase-like predicted oxidoreductase